MELLDDSLTAEARRPDGSSHARRLSSLHAEFRAGSIGGHRRSAGVRAVAGTCPRWRSPRLRRRPRRHRLPSTAAQSVRSWRPRRSRAGGLEGWDGGRCPSRRPPRRVRAHVDLATASLHHRSTAQGYRPPATAGSVEGAPPEDAVSHAQINRINRRKCVPMTEKKVWFITGAGRGMGVDIAKAALAAGHAVVATGRNPERVSPALGEHDDLLAVTLDVTDPADAEAAVAGRRRPVRSHRRAGQQRRQLLRRVLRGDQPRGLPGPDRDHPVRPDQRHPRRAARSCAPSAPASS